VRKDDGAGTGYVQSACVAPERRGEGMGTALVRVADARIFQGSPNVFLSVSSFNPGARKLYERLGYTQVGAFGDHLVTGHGQLSSASPSGPSGRSRRRGRRVIGR
jgi:ribosomal-protein-alanine N-acetyltransferase